MKTPDYYFGLEGPGATEDTLIDMQDWLFREKLPGLRADPKASPPNREEMGAAIETILSVILGSASVVQLAKAVSAWVKERKPKIQFIVSNGKKSLKVTLENVATLPKALEDALKDLSH